MFLSLNTKSSIKFGLIIVSMIFLTYASFTSQKYGFYTSLKVFIFVSSLYMAVLSYGSKQKFWFLRFLIIAVIYNPFIRLPFGKTIWKPINIVTLVFYSIALLRFRIDDDETLESPFAIDPAFKKKEDKTSTGSTSLAEIENLKKEIQDLKQKQAISEDVINSIEYEKIKHFDSCSYFHNGLAPVGKNKKFGFIDKNGTIAIDLKYDYISYFFEGISTVINNGEYELIDKNGITILKPHFTYLDRLSNGLIAFSVSDGKYNKKEKMGYINIEGKIVIEAKFHFAERFAEGFARVKKESFFTGWGYINTIGKYVIPPRFYRVGDFSEGLAPAIYQKFIVAFDSDDKIWGYINTDGKFVLISEKLPWNILRIEMAPYCKIIQKKSKFVDYGGDVSETFIKFNPIFNNNSYGRLQESSFDELSNFSEGLAGVVLDEYRGGVRKYGFINKNGEEVIEARFDEIKPFSEGLALIRLDNKYGFIDKNGNEIIKPKYEEAASFSEGLALVVENEKKKYIVNPLITYPNRFKNTFDYFTSQGIFTPTDD